MVRSLGWFEDSLFIQRPSASVRTASSSPGISISGPARMASPSTSRGPASQRATPSSRPKHPDPVAQYRWRIEPLTGEGGRKLQPQMIQGMGAEQSRPGLWKLLDECPVAGHPPWPRGQAPSLLPRPFRNSARGNPGLIRAVSVKRYREPAIALGVLNSSVTLSGFIFVAVCRIDADQACCHEHGHSQPLLAAWQVIPDHPSKQNAP